MRERTALPRSVIAQLPNLKFIAATGPHNRTIDFDATRERGITVSCTSDMGLGAAATAEMTWALILACVRNVALEDRGMRGGAWQNSLGTTLYGKTLGLIGLGRIGATMAKIGHAFGMKIVAWSPNLTDEKAAAAGAQRVAKDALFRQSDVVSLHLVLGERSRGIVALADLQMMKPSAYLINTARGPLVREADLIAALRDGLIAGAGIDVYDHEPLPQDHPLRALSNNGSRLAPYRLCYRGNHVPVLSGNGRKHCRLSGRQADPHLAGELIVVPRRSRSGHRHRGVIATRQDEIRGALKRLHRRKYAAVGRTIKVLDLTHAVSGPTLHVSSRPLGADIVKVEKLFVGDDMRHYLMHAGLENMSGPFIAYTWASARSRWISRTLTRERSSTG